MPTLKRFLTTSSLMLKNKLARSLYCPLGHVNCLKFPELPVVGQFSDPSEGHSIQAPNHGNPITHEEVIRDTNTACKIFALGP